MFFLLLLLLLLPLSLMFPYFHDMFLWILSLASPSSALLSFSHPSHHKSSYVFHVTVGFRLVFVAIFNGISDGVFRKQAITSGKNWSWKGNTQKPTRKIWIAILCAQIIYLQSSVGVAGCFLLLPAFARSFAWMLAKFSQQVLWIPRNLQMKKHRERRGKKTQIRRCYHRSLIATSALCVRVLYLAASIDTLFFLFLLSFTIHSIPIAFISNNKMLNKQAACAHEMHRQMIPLLRTFSFAFFSFLRSLAISCRSRVFIWGYPFIFAFFAALQHVGIFAWWYSSLENWFCVSQIDA